MKISNGGRPIAIDLFAGCGGMSLGLEAAGFDIGFSIEYDAIHALIHHYNFPYSTTICKDITKLKSSEILNELKLRGYSTEVDLIAGGPPCQGFSHIGKRQLDDPRNALVYEYLRVISEMRPKYFIFENVPGITTGDHRKFLIELIKEFESIGYRIPTPQILDASGFGAPQKRKRLILLGSRSDLVKAEYPVAKYGAVDNDALFEDDVIPFTTVSDAISDLENIDAFIGKDEGIAIERLDYTARRLKYSVIPQDDFLLCHQRAMANLVYGHIGSAHTQQSIDRFVEAEPGSVEPNSRFFKLSADGLCNTIRAGTTSEKGAYTAPRPIHYATPRCITVREAARLHTFPDWFQFHRTIWHGFREIGNAVIPLLAKELGSSVIHALNVNPTIETNRVLEEVPAELLNYNMSQASDYWGIADDVIPKRKKLT